MCSVGRRLIWWFGCVAGALTLTACGAVLNPELLTALNISPGVASVPGEAPALLVEIENRTNRTIETRLTWRGEEEDVDERNNTIPPGLSIAEALICPVEEVTLGDVSDLERVGAIVRLGAGESGDPFIEVEPFGVLLQEGANYDCGDSITFRVQPSAQTRSGFQIFAFIRRTGAQ